MAENVPDAPVEEIVQAAEAAPDTMALLQFFEQMDSTAPLLRLMIAGGIAAVALLLMVVSRNLVQRRLKRIEQTPEEKFDPLRWQAQAVRCGHLDRDPA